MTLKLYAGKQYSRTISKEPSLTITKYGLINLNKVTMATVGSGWLYAQLGADRDTKELIVKFGCSATERGAHKICKADKGGVRIGAKNFFEWAGIDYSETCTFPVTYDESRRMLTARLAP
jgi:hypothetical protein